jgi:hypothetical protein
LLDPNEKLNDDYQQQIFRTHGSLLMNNPDLANAMFGSGSETLTAPELLKNFHNYSRDAFGPNYRQVASDLNSAMERERSLRSAARGDFVPDAPWKQTSEWTKLALKRALRVAADYGYDGVALSPGWVQKERWRNEDHKNLYDNLMGNTFRNLAKQHGLKVGNSTIQQLRDYARRKRVTDKSADSATAVYLNDDDRAKIRKHGFGLFKRGGFVAKADGGEVKDLLATADRLGVDKANIPALQNLRGMMGTHKNLMQAIRDETNSRMEQARQLHESGVLPFPVGTRFSTKHSRENGLPPFNVRGHYVNPKTGRYGYFVERGHPDSDFHEQTVMYADKPEITTEFQPYGISVAKAYGGGVEETVPEAPHTLAAQLQAFLQGKRRAVLYTHEEPALPEGAGRLETPHGVFHYNPALIDADAIKDAVAKDKINEVLGLGPYSKADIMERVASGEPGVAVVGRDAEGKEFLSATGTPGTFSEQAAAIAPQLPPGGQVRAENPANVLFERVMAARSPDQGGKDARKALMIAKAKGGGIEDDDAPDRELDKSGFYNAAAEAAKAIPQAKGTPQQMLSMVQKAPGTQEAMKWSGADQAFADQPIVSKDDLVNHFKTNAPKLEETQFGGRQSNMPTKYSSKTIPGGENYREVLLHLPPEGLLKITPANLDRINFLKQNKSDLIRKTADAMADWKRISEENAPGHPQTLEAYQQVKDTRNSLRSVEEELENLTKDFGKNKYNSPHWDKSNVVAHLRMSDRTLPQTGEKALHLEELQSDWGQAGREGFKKTDEELRGLRDEMLAAHKNYLALHAAGAPSDELKAAEDKYNSAMDVFNKGFKANTPEGPYVGNTAKWTELGLKRALIEAARNGHDKLVWTPGDEQALRYKENDEENDAKRLKGMNKYYGEIVPSQLEKILRSIGHTAEFGTDYIKDKPYEADLDVYKHAGTGKYHVATGDKRDAPDAEDITAGPFDTYAEAMAHRDKLYKGLKAVPSLKITPAMRATISKGLPPKTGGYVPSAKNAAVEQALKLTTKSGATLPAAVAIARQHQPGRRN